MDISSASQNNKPGAIRTAIQSTQSQIQSDEDSIAQANAEISKNKATAARKKVEGKRELQESENHKAESGKQQGKSIALYAAAAAAAATIVGAPAAPALATAAKAAGTAAKAKAALGATAEATGNEDLQKANSALNKAEAAITPKNKTLDKIQEGLAKVDAATNLMNAAKTFTPLGGGAMPTEGAAQQFGGAQKLIQDMNTLTDGKMNEALSEYSEEAGLGDSGEYGARAAFGFAVGDKSYMSNQAAGVFIEESGWGDADKLEYERDLLGGFAAQNGAMAARGVSGILAKGLVPMFTGGGMFGGAGTYGLEGEDLEAALAEQEELDAENDKKIAMFADLGGFAFSDQLAEGGLSAEEQTSANQMFANGFSALGESLGPEGRDKIGAFVFATSNPDASGELAGLSGLGYGTPYTEGTGHTPSLAGSMLSGASEAFDGNSNITQEGGFDFAGTANNINSFMGNYVNQESDSDTPNRNSNEISDA